MMVQTWPDGPDIGHKTTRFNRINQNECMKNTLVLNETFLNGKNKKELTYTSEKRNYECYSNLIHHQQITEHSQYSIFNLL